VSPGQPPTSEAWVERFHALPKAELHVHLEGTIEPATVVALAKKYGDVLDEATVAARYATRDFAAFIEAYKWVTSYLRAPADYALVASGLAEQWIAQNVVYSEGTLSIGVMLLRKQDVAANFRAIREAVAPYEARGLHVQWIFDVVRQFGAAAAYEVARCAVELRSEGVIAFGMGGDELSRPAAEFRDVYDYAAAHGLHRIAHAGEIGGPDSVRDAVNFLGAERIGHGIAAAADPELMTLLAARAIALEVCPTSNMRTGALDRYVGHANATLADHPLPRLLRADVPICISTDDPAMFGTSLAAEFSALGNMGLSARDATNLAEGGFRAAFLPPDRKAALLQSFHAKAKAFGLL
jgi:aminodeoxyfutalosine deaminase